MPLDRFKTQVLILHSEQSALDNLSSGFTDSYTVHCATSGSEALNTLVETPINVIISAQDLPGMSGLEALREAKKRSPDTIGILLAGSADDGLEALVGDKEVFQVVRGNVTGDSILKLVDDATRQLRLMALAESANDIAANLDEPASEHIVMETSENGSTIISDGTGRMPTLDPTKVSTATSIGSRSIDLLVLTKDQEFLSTIKDSSRGMHNVHYANTLAQATETIRKHKVGVAVVDAAMVGEKVEQLTQHLRKGSPRLVSIVAGRRDDGEMLMDLINRGKVYRFLLKPVSPGRARLAVEASVKHHLEAPDAAFKVKPGVETAAPAGKPVPKAVPKAQTKPQPAPETKPKPAAKAEKPAPQLPTPSDPPLGSPLEPVQSSPVVDGLSSAFGDDDSNFTETITGLFSAVGKKFSGDQDSEKPDVETRSPEIDSAPTAAGSGGSLLQNPKMLGIGALAIIVIAGALFWSFSGSDAPAPVEQPLAGTPLISEADVVFDSAPAAETASVDVDALVDEARLARDAGQIFNPLGSNAIELYAAAVSADPANEFVAAEFDAVLQQALGMAETALLEARLDDADAALQRVSSVDPDNSRLPFLAAQLSQMQLRGYLAEARNSIREARFEDAASSLASARSLNVSDSTEIDLVVAELSTARSEQRTDEVLAQANARVEQGNLLNPPNDNARYYYELVLSNDPENTAARQGLSVVASKLALQARSEIDNGNLDAAQDLLDDANALDPSNSELAAAIGALSDKRDAISAQRQKAEAARRAAAERKAAEERAAAEAAQVAAKRAAEQEAAQAAAKRTAEQEAAQAAAALLPPEAQTTTEEAAGNEAAPVDDADAEEGTVAGDTGTAVVEDAASNEPATEEVAIAAPAPARVTNAKSSPPPAAVSSLNRTKYVAPKYPRSAERRNLSGWVDVVFTVSMNGSVKDIEIRDSEPGDVFANAAIKAVEKWEFEPVIENGVLVERRTAVRMMFALE